MTTTKTAPGGYARIGAALVSAALLIARRYSRFSSASICAGCNGCKQTWPSFRTCAMAC
jgi:hypothetical protein